MSLFSMTTHPVVRAALIHTASPEFVAERRLFLKGLFPRGRSASGIVAPGTGLPASVSGRAGHLVV